jgi:acyl-CoA synthetase (AMP-forming)/AMP-acid ligase II
VETAIAQHPDVAEVACAEISPREGVTVIGAFLVAKPGHAVDVASVLAFAKERLAQYKCPREVVVVEALPRTPNGKVKRSELQKAYRTQN